MQGQYHLQAPLGLNCGSSICLQEHIKEKQEKKKKIQELHKSVTLCQGWVLCQVIMPAPGHVT